MRCVSAAPPVATHDARKHPSGWKNGCIRADRQAEGFAQGRVKKKKKKEKESNHNSLCCVVFLMLYIQIDFLIWYVLWIWMCARSTSESPEAQRDGTL